MKMRLKRLIVEAHRRSLWQVLSIYVVASWIGYEVIVNLTQGIGLPHWVPGFAIVLFLIGLPIVLATAFVQEGLPAHAEAASRKRARRREPKRSVADAADTRRTGEAQSPAERTRRRQHWLFTWQRAVLGGIVAFLLLGITAGGYMGMRNAGVGPFGSLVASGKLDARDRILIADFDTGEADADMAAAAAQALRVDLAQASLVSIVEQRYVRDVLERMGLAPAARLDAELAREIAVRDGIKALVTGEVRRAGRGYVLSADLVAAADGSVLASFRESAADSMAVLGAVDRLSRRMRERIGESLRSVNASLPLEAVTTPSLEALRKYSQAVHAMDVELEYEVAIALLHEAIAIDSSFGMAWRKLAVANNNMGAGRARVAEAATRAYAYRDRMTQRERDHATAYYHMHATRDNHAAIAAYRALIQAYPDDRTALHNVALLYAQTKQYDLALEHYERAIAADSLSTVSYTNLIDGYMHVGREADGDRLLALYTQKFGETRFGLLRQFHLAANAGDYAAATASAQRIRELRPGDPLHRANSAHALADVAAVLGRLAESERHRTAAILANVERGNPWAQLNGALGHAEYDLFIRRDARRALQRLDQAIAAYPPASYPVLNRPYLRIAEDYAFAGRPDRARQFLADYEREMPADMRGDDRVPLSWTRSSIALAEGNVAEAIRLARLAEDLDICERCVHFAMAEIFDRAEQPDSAADRYERYVTAPNAQKIWSDQTNLPRAHERLAELYAERGDDNNAARHAGRFIELWQNADAELQPRVRVIRELLMRVRPAG